MIGFENIVIGKNSIPSLAITVILMAVIPFIFFIYWRRKHKQQTNISYLIAGAVGFMVSARVLELGVHYFCILADNPVSRFINGSSAAFVLYGTIMAGVFEECGRYIVLKYIMKKNRTRENAVLYGIGHGGIEILAVLLPAMILYLTIAIMFSSGDIENALSVLKITEETAAAGTDCGSDRRGDQNRAVRAADIHEPERRVREAPAEPFQGAPGEFAGDL